MNHQNELLASVIEHLGVPLVTTASHISRDGQGSGEQEAQIAARLLSASVKLGMGLSEKMNMVSDEDRAEALRFRLTALGANIIAKRVEVLDKEIADADIDKIKSMVESVLAFSDKFTLSSDSVDYLSQMNMGVLGSKEAVDIRTLEAMLPLVTLIQQNPMGQDPNNLIQNIAERLLDETNIFSDKLKAEGEESDKLRHLLDQQIFKVLVNSLSQAYTRELASDNPSLNNVWEQFDETKGIALVLCDYLVSGEKHIETSQEGQGSVAPTAPQTQQAPQQAQTQQAQPQQSQPQQQAPATSGGSGDSSGKPAIFSQKKPTQQGQQAAPPQQPPQQQAQQQSASSTDTSSAQAGQGGDPNNPMSFFKKKS